MTTAKHRSRFVACVENEGYEVSLELCRLYRQLGDSDAERRGMVRIVDESGEDYLFPRELFVPVELAEEASRKLLKLGRQQKRR